MYMKKRYFFKMNFVLSLLFFTTGVLAQKQISGQVTAGASEPLPGVAVFVKGTSDGTTTDFDGNYVISNVSDNATLVFSFLGFVTKEVLIGNQSTINVILEEDITALDDVVVVGYGTKKKAEVTGAVAQVSGELTSKSPNANFTTSLAGRLPGLVINQTTAEPGRENINILVRGQGTFRDNSVLIVIDGVIGADGLSGLDPQDIESVSVLKDASAAIYGARAANGVILVTTKRGATGKPVLNYTINSSFSSPTRFAERASALDYALQARAITNRDAANQVPVLFTDAEIDAFRAPGFRSTDWFREVYDNTSFQTRHNLSLRGGSDRVSYFTSLGLTQREGIINTDRSTDVNQYNFRSNIDMKPTDNVKVSLDLSGRFDKNEYFAPNSFNVLLNTARGLPTDIALIDGKPIKFDSTNDGANPFAFVQDESGYRRNENTLFNGKLSLEYQIPYVTGLSIAGWANFRFVQNFGKTFERPFSQYILENNGSLTEDIIDIETKVTEAYGRTQDITSNFRIAYDNTFGKHNVSTFLAYEQNISKFNFTETSRRGFLSNNIDQLSSGSVDTQENGATANEEARQNYFGRLAYDFNKKYFAQFQFRYDGSFNFPKGDRFGFFPSVSLGWRLSEESFLKNSKIISNLKLRGTWGEVGNDRVPAFQFLNRFGVDGSFPFGTGNLTDFTVVSQVGSVANPNITWETETKRNIGLDMGLFQNKLTLELDVFKDSRTGILAPRNVTVPVFTGIINRPDENIGETENKGFEVVLGYRNNFGEFGFNASANFAYSKNKIVFQDAVPPVEDYQNLEGQPIGSRLLYNAIGIYRTQDDLDNNPGPANVGIGDLIYADTNGDGAITADDRIVFDKTAIPSAQFGLNLGLTYKGFELNTLFQGQTDVNFETRAIFGQGDLAYVLKNAYTVDTPNVSLPRIGGTESNRNGYNGGEFASTFWQRDASFVRLRNVELAYSFPKDIISKVGVSGFRVYFSGSNLLVFDGLKKDGLADPEQTDGLSWQIPLQQIFNLGANITF